MKRLLLVTFALLLLAGCGDEAVSKKFDVSLYVGTYVGTWTNSATGATGAARIEIAADTAARTASLTIDFDGNYLGLDNPPAMALSGVYDDDKATVKGQSELFGAYDVTIDADGKIVGVMKGLAGGLIPEMTYTGALTRDRLDADYTVKFADGRVVNSILRMEK